MSPKRSMAWEFFDKSSDGLYVTCKFCKRTFKFFGNTSNLNTHLKSQHQVKYPTANEASQEEVQDNQTQSNSIPEFSTTQATSENTTGSLCKIGLNNNRNNLRKSMHKRDTLSERSQNKSRKHKYEDELGFLLPLLEERKSIGSNLSETSESQIDGEEFEESERYCLKVENDVDEGESYINGLDDVQNRNDERLNDPLETTTSQQPIKDNVPNAYRILPKRKHISDILSERRKYIIKRRRSTEMHPVDTFLSGLAPTLKSLTPYYLNLAKSKIFAAVQEYELAMLKEQKNSGSARSISPNIQCVVSNIP